MDSYKPVEYPVFRRMDENLIAGISAKTVLFTLIAAAFGVFLYVALGSITTTQPQEVGYAQRSGRLVELERMRDAMRYLEAEELLAEVGEDGALELEMSVLATSTLSGLDHAGIEGLAQAGSEAGLGPDMGADDIAALVPEIADVTVAALSAYERIVISALPAIAVVALRYEANGVSILRAIGNRLAFNRSQKSYFYRRQGKGSAQ